jgi:hypothetical protein
MEDNVMLTPIVRTFRAFAVFFALVLLPQTAFSLELFEGNVGYEGDWLHVLEAPAMGDQIYWYDLGDEVTYQVQCANDIDFTSLVLNEGGIVPNYVVPDLGPGFYHFRVRESHSSGVTGSWSDTGTLEVVEDLELPQAQIVSPVAGQTFSQGDTIPIELEVSDDTVLHLARFTIGGDYAGILGLKTENYKVKPSFGESRFVVFNYQLPANGKSGALEISVDVTDVAHNSVTATVVVNTTKSSSDTTSSTEKKGKGWGRNK